MLENFNRFSFPENERKNKTFQWLGKDNLNNYSLTNYSKPNYTKEDITYKFNSDGFRCDEFLLRSDLPILFMGCSFTEGVGLPLHHCWPYFILEYYKNLPENNNKQIPFFSLAIGGTGADTAARVLLQHVDKIKPKYIFWYLSSGHRREYCFDSELVKKWLPAHANEHHNPHIDKIFSDEYYAAYKTCTSLNTIQFIASVYNIKVFIATPQESYAIISNYLSNWPLLNIFAVTEQDICNQPIIDEIKNCPPKARDLRHPGVSWQYGLANIFKTAL